MSNEIEVRLVLDDGTYKKAILKAEDQSEKSGKKIGKNLKTGTDAFGRGLTSLKGAILSAGAAFVAAFGARAAIQASIRQQDAVQGLNQALRSAGTFSVEASNKIQAFAAEIEKTTTVSDEAALEQLALARAFSRSNDEAVELTRAAIELSAATGIEVESAVRNLGKSFSGLLGELGELLPATRNLTQEQLKSGEALNFVLQRFGGSAAAQVKTFSGAITQLQNTFGTLLEQIGDTVTKSAALRGVFQVVSEALNTITGSVEGANLSAQFDQLIIRILGVGEAINTVFGVPLEIAFNSVKMAVNGIKLAFQTLIAGVANGASKVVSFFAPSSELAKGLQVFKESSAEVFRSFEDNAIDSVLAVGDTSITEGFDSIIVKMKEAAQQAVNTGDSFTEMKKKAKFNETEIADTQTSFEVLQESMQSFKSGFVGQLNELQNNGKKAFQQLGASAVSGLANTAGSAFAAFGKAVAEGNNAIDAFLNALLASFGQAAIQMGTNFILQGIAYQFAGLPNGAALIGAGAALAAFGGVLSSLGGGGGEATAGAGGGSVGAGPGGPIPVEGGQDQFPDPEDRINQGPSIAVNVQGNVVNQKEFGLELVDILNQTFEGRGASLA